MFFFGFFAMCYPPGCSIPPCSFHTARRNSESMKPPTAILTCTPPLSCRRRSSVPDPTSSCATAPPIAARSSAASCGTSSGRTSAGSATT